MMSRVQKGLVAGFAATVVISALEAVNILLLNSMFAPFPGVIARVLGMDGNLAAGWAIHFVVGTFVLGGLFGVLCPRLPTDTPETKGILFAVAIWVAMMVVMAMSGDTLVFGRNFGTLGWMLMTHAVFGIVMGNVYARLVERERRRGHDVVHGATAH
jgi:hypothetical protein